LEGYEQPIESSQGNDCDLYAERSLKRAHARFFKPVLSIGEPIEISRFIGVVVDTDVLEVEIIGVHTPQPGTQHGIATQKKGPRMMRGPVGFLEYV
jgi:hypothetical protein